VAKLAPHSFRNSLTWRQLAGDIVLTSFSFCPRGILPLHAAERDLHESAYHRSNRSGPVLRRPVPSVSFIYDPSMWLKYDQTINLYYAKDWLIIQSGRERPHCG